SDQARDLIHLMRVALPVCHLRCPQLEPLRTVTVSNSPSSGRITAPDLSTQLKLSHLLWFLSMYDLRRLRAFHAAAHSGSFSAAPRQLGYTQSLASRHVAALESELGLTLVNRATRPVCATDAGRRLLRHTEAALGYIAAAEDELRAVAGLERG